MRRPRPIASLITAAAVAVGCGGHHVATPVRAARAGERATLTAAHPCPGQPGFTCATLRVPLDHAGQAGGTLALTVGAAPAVAGARHGVLVFLTGGPGQPGIPFLSVVQARLRAALTGYRLVMLDQRGTGAGALRCPALQAAAGASDLTAVPASDVAACARLIGPRRRYYTTAETVADLESLRAALGVARLTLDGVSYGTFVAERYALRYPARVARLVLDSVVPQSGVDPLYRAALSRSTDVLRAVCAAQRCGWDPAADLAAVVRRLHDGPALLDALVADSVGAPDYPWVLDDLHAARAGRPAALRAWLAAVHRADSAPADYLSQGLHQSTLCLELAGPWDPAAPGPRRAATLRALAAATPESDLYPFDRATALANGLAQGCLAWPATAPPDLPGVDAADAPLPPVPVLLLSGERDLSTPPAWARREAALAPDGRLLEVPQAGHSIQLRPANVGARQVLARFLGGTS